MIGGKIVLKESGESIRKKAIRALASKLSQVFVKAKPKISTKVKVLFIGAVQETDEYKSLVGGSAESGNLQAELGVADAQAKLGEIIMAWVNGFKINVVPVKGTSGKLTGGIIVQMVRVNYAEVLTLHGSIVRHKSFPSEEVIEWLDWLLNGGDTTIVNYSIAFNLKSGEEGRSRTGLALMFESPGMSWKMPDQWVGFPDNNFVTRALASVSTQVQQVMMDEVKKQIR